MSFEELSIQVEALSKRYEIYSQPSDRLRQMVLPRLQRLARIPAKSYFNEFWALHNVNLEVRRGETIGIVGRNGSGKSTLLQLICGTLTPTAGRIVVNGRVAALLELGTGFNPEFTGRENVYLNATVLGLSRAEIDARFDDIAAFADIGNFIEQPVKTYSSGMYVRLAFAVAINVDPEILVIDEALSVGDELFQRKCFARIEAIRSKGATILFVSHAAGSVVELCDRAVLVDAGEVLATGQPKQIIAQYQKLLYSPADKVLNVREEIRSGHGEPAEAPTGGRKTGPGQASGGEIFDPELKPSSTIVFNSRGVFIENARILATDGREINGLIRGRRYRFCYRVKTSKILFKVRFGCLIKSMTGLPICGTISEPSLRDGMTIEGAGKTISVEFEFDCLLNPGLYFMNAGVFGIEDDQEVLLHRISDVLVFRVLPVEANRSTELIDFNCRSKVVLDG